eukprot:3096998-Alexandrium_andersonii.AAC.1
MRKHARCEYGNRSCLAGSPVTHVGTCAAPLLHLLIGRPSRQPELLQFRCTLGSPKSTAPMWVRHVDESTTEEEEEEPELASEA